MKPWNMRQCVLTWANEEVWLNWEVQIGYSRKEAAVVALRGQKQVSCPAHQGCGSHAGWEDDFRNSTLVAKEERDVEQHLWR